MLVVVSAGFHSTVMLHRPHTLSWLRLVSQVADRQNYLLLSLLLCFCLGLLLFTHRRHSAAAAPVPLAADLEPPTAKSYSCCLPER